MVQERRPYPPTEARPMTYKEPTPESREKMLWLVNDSIMTWLANARGRTISDTEKLDRIMLGLAGGYRNNGARS